MVRMNIVVPDEVAAHLKKVPNKSRYIVLALEERIRRERSKVLRAQLAEAYSSSAKEDRLTNQEWSSTLQDGGWA